MARYIPASTRWRVLFGGTLQFWAWGAMFVGIGLSFLATNFADRAFLIFDASALVVEGRVSNLAESGFSEGGNRKTRRKATPVFRVNYEFTDHAGTARKGISYAPEPNLNINDIVKIEYLSDHPDTSRIAGFRTAPARVEFNLLFILPVAAMIALAFARRRSARIYQLLAHGEIAQCEVLSVTPTYTKINNQRVHRRTLQFRTSAGASMTVNDRQHDRARVTAGLREELLYDVTNPMNFVTLASVPGRPRFLDDGREVAPSPSLGVFGVLILPIFTLAAAVAVVVLNISR